jgi:alginate O-acetyltransferase complex protein AlgI
MLFNSLQFLIFFPVVTALYFRLPHAHRWYPLLIASCYFYMALVPAYILVLFFLIAIDYTAGLLIESSQGTKRKQYLVLSLIANVGILVAFKYFNFFNNTLAGFLHIGHVNYEPLLLGFVLPIGLSFHTFQSMSYTIEVYRRKQKAERHLGIYALYVMFYPQLVAGPIERPQNLLHQFREKHDFDYDRVTSGLRLMLWGFFKKVVIADRLAILVNQVYLSPSKYSGVQLLLATYCFTVQVYCDFSGYSDIAIGAAEVMGFRLMKNFDRPFFSETTADFWKRWHISLSSWFRDYLYIPLGGSRVSPLRHISNLLFVFALCGLWHGAAWTYVSWGCFVGICFAFSMITRELRLRLNALTGLTRVPMAHQFLKILVTIHLFSASLVIFRSRSLSDAAYTFRAIFTDVPFAFARAVSGWTLAPLSAGIDTLGLGPFDLLLAGVSSIFLLSVEFAQGRQATQPQIARWPFWTRWAVYYAAAVTILVFGKFTEQKFIYFQF